MNLYLTSGRSDNVEIRKGRSRVESFSKPLQRRADFCSRLHHIAYEKLTILFTPFICKCVRIGKDQKSLQLEVLSNMCKP